MKKKNVCKTPWTSEIGAIMNKYVKEKIIRKHMYPAFGTLIVDSDLIIYLNINTILLKERCESRGANINNSLNMKSEIEKELQKTDKAIIEICY